MDHGANVTDYKRAFTVVQINIHTYSRRLWVIRLEFALRCSSVCFFVRVSVWGCSLLGCDAAAVAEAAADGSKQLKTSRPSKTRSIRERAKTARALL